MLPIYICDDLAVQLTLYTEAIEDCLTVNHLTDNVKIVCTAQSPTDVLNQVCERKTRGLYFLDVDLGDDEMSGIDLGVAIRKLDPRGYIVFVTTHDECSLLAFKMRVEAMDYIIKDGPDVTGQICACILEACRREKMELPPPAEPIRLRVEGAFLTYLPDDIYYIAVDDHMLEIGERDNTTHVRGSLADVYKQLGEPFYKCHKSHVVNLRHVKAVNQAAHKIVLDNGTIIPVSFREMRTVYDKYSSALK